MNEQYNQEPAVYFHFYIKDGVTNQRLIPARLKDKFMERFGNYLLNADEQEVDEFLKQK